MVHAIPLEDAIAQLHDLVNRARNGETILLTSGREVALALVPGTELDHSLSEPMRAACGDLQLRLRQVPWA